MDESLVLAVVDLSGRPYLAFEGFRFDQPAVGGFDTSLTQEFFRLSPTSAAATCTSGAGLRQRPPRDRGGVQSHRQGAAGGRGQGPADQRHSLDEGTPGMIAIVDYDMGNLRSVQKAFERVGAFRRRHVFAGGRAAGPGVVVPGVGRVRKGHGKLGAAGARRCRRRTVREGKPYLGICLGYQLLFESSEERFGEGAPRRAAGSGAEGDPGAGEAARLGAPAAAEPAGLGLLKGKVRRFPPGCEKCPRSAGTSAPGRETPLFEGVPDGSYVYFVHSYFPDARGSRRRRRDHGVRGRVCLGRLRAATSGPCSFTRRSRSRVGLAILANFGRAVER